MGYSISDLTKMAEECTCGLNHFEINIEEITIKKHALQDAVNYLQKKSYQNVMIVVDDTTYEAAGKQLCEQLTVTNIYHQLCYITPDKNNDVVADEVSLVQVLLETPNDVDVILAVGSGTIHDIVRFVSYKMGKPFISIATAPSVDGFNSMGAPLVIKGMKQTFQLHSPIAVFGDLSILQDAPKKMIAAGFGDMIGKYTSLTDWKFGHLTANEPYCPLVAKVTEEALISCAENVDRIADGDEEGIRILFDALVQSGLAMLLMGQSHPASGGEHHLSHYWEMEFLKAEVPQILHGAKVGVTCQLISETYKGRFKEGLQNGAYSDLDPFKEELIELINSIPEPAHIKKMIEDIGGDATPESLGVSQQLIDRSVAEAHNLRNRYTILRYLNEHTIK
ncbi:sn-glycerol-1-phosphate dehydrogenase [Litchfieldia salsa]|uniref:Glycerol-1-phosphate dehydrogenase [NAD(P)+] n=1 Tax=Litchfieldia salsa TaxID=930152 RepID=A0A1H0WDB7_9BACI|nr:sn-glycerol-1-phosphate dehydrogenase [Litchfieldia salsa]SDP88531.1 glycerol-1-phosphate dehydrogenase [NAD(P)+] [Litchfieldia salsa]